MSRYTFEIRPMERIKTVERDGETLDASDAMVVFADRWFLVGCDGELSVVPEEAEIPDALAAYLTLDFPDDDAALGFVRTFDYLALDPWRVDCVYREQEPPDPLVADAEIYAYGDFDSGCVTI